VCGAVPKDVTGDLAGGSETEQPSQRRGTRVEPDRHAAEHLELGQLLACPSRLALRRAIWVSQERRRREDGPDEAAR
jgi:hypothetical protein